MLERKRKRMAGRRQEACRATLLAAVLVWAMPLIFGGCGGGGQGVAQGSGGLAPGGAAGSPVAWMETARLQPAGPSVAGIAAVRLPVPDDDRWIVHVLNRLGYGPRPGDVERVRQMGLANYIAQQFTPERIPDPVVEAKLQPLRTLAMSPSDLYAAYPQPKPEERRARKEARERGERGEGRQGGPEAGQGARGVRPRALARMDPFGPGRGGGEMAEGPGRPEPGRRAAPEGRRGRQAAGCTPRGTVSGRRATHEPEVPPDCSLLTMRSRAWAPPSSSRRSGLARSHAGGDPGDADPRRSGDRVAAGP